MSRRPKITDRSTSLAHAFVHVIIPREDELAQRLNLYRKAGIKPDECAYCGDRASDTDHFRSLVKGGRPSGHFHTADNLVPSCGRCNQSKSGADWRTWMRGPAKHSPASRQIDDLEGRIARLAAFDALSIHTAKSEAELREIVDPDLWDAYWNRLTAICQALAEAERDAGLIRCRWQAATEAQHVPE